MRIMLDTNVLVDYLICRAPFDRAAEQIVDICRNEKNCYWHFVKYLRWKVLTEAS